MNRLTQIGFELAGHWRLNDDLLNYTLTRHAAQTNVLYAFICDGQVMYVGKTVRPLRRRMDQYARPHETQTTNVANSRNIREQLCANVAVEILALPDSGLMHYGQFHLNLAAGLEDSIIRLIEPPWNGPRANRLRLVNELAAQAEVRLVAEEATVHEHFEFLLRPIYHQRGFFNVRVAAGELIGPVGAIELYLADAPSPTIGVINRTANANGAPRIMGGAALRQWFGQFAIDTRMVVDVMTPTSIRIRAR